MVKWLLGKKEFKYFIKSNLSPIEKGQYAKELLKNPLINELFEQIELQSIGHWKHCHVADRDGKEFLWITIQVLDKIKLMLQGYISEALIEEDRTQQKEREVDYA